MNNTNATDKDRQAPDKPVELPDCIAYPTGATCPVEWCRDNRGEWCKRNGEWCRWRRY